LASGLFLERTLKPCLARGFFHRRIKRHARQKAPRQGRGFEEEERLEEGQQANPFSLTGAEAKESPAKAGLVTRPCVVSVVQLPNYHSLPQAFVIL